VPERPDNKAPFMTQAFPRFGRYETHILHDGLFEAPADVLTHTGGEAARQQAVERLGSATIRVDVNCFLLRDADGITLVDAGAGTAWGPAFGAARIALRAAGIAPEQVDRVLLTHLHEDHALGLFDDMAPAFPRAAIWVPQADLAFFSDPRMRDATPDARRGGFVLAERVRQTYGDRVRGIPDGTVLDGIDTVSLPGHTPGHTGYLLRSDGDSLLIWGDALHLEQLQPVDPEIGLVFDLDPALAARTRRAILEQATQERWIIAGSHVSGFMRAEKTADAFRLTPVQVV
jgi:glyoxylase-like metal-dependent hydrolase (beta-lactamase superfamily II)